MHSLILLALAAGEHAADDLSAMDDESAVDDISIARIIQNITDKGGFSDVGLRTGSECRGTCWPLVREVLRVR